MILAFNWSSFKEFSVNAIYIFAKSVNNKNMYL